MKKISKLRKLYSKIKFSVERRISEEIDDFDTGIRTSVRVDVNDFLIYNIPNGLFYDKYEILKAYKKTYKLLKKDKFKERYIIGIYITDPYEMLEKVREKYKNEKLEIGTMILTYSDESFVVTKGGIISLPEKNNKLDKAIGFVILDLQKGF